MGINFPNSPTIDQLYPQPAVAGLPVYRWDGEKWTTQGASPTKTPVYTDGTTPMTAQLTLIAPPVNPTDAAAKSYVDAAQHNILDVSIASTVNAGALTVTLNSSTGVAPSASTPLYFDFRSATATPPTQTRLAVTAALSLTVPSGATLGTANAAAFRLWLVLFNDAGISRLGIINSLASGNYICPLTEAEAVSSTAISASANSGGVFYTNVAVTSCSYRILGYLEWSSGGVSPAGTWTLTNLIRSVPFGYGVKKPGDIVTSSWVNQGAGITASSGAYVTAMQISFPIKSAADVIRCCFNAAITILAGGAGTNTTAGTRVARGATVISQRTTGISSSSGANMQTNCGDCHQVMDFPNQVGVLLYAYQIASTGAATSATASFVNGQVDEIMT